MYTHTALDNKPSVAKQQIAVPSSTVIGALLFGLILIVFAVDRDVQNLSSTFLRFIGEKLLTADQKAEAFTGRDWLFDGLKVRASNADVRAIVIQGSAGVGKSAIVAKILSTLGTEQQRKLGLDLSSFPSTTSTTSSGLNVLACHFCKHNDANTLNISLFTRVLGATLARTVPGFRMSPTPLRSADPADELRVCVLEPLKECKAPSLPAGAVTHCILIDSLDESLVVEESSQVRLHLVMFVMRLCSPSPNCWLTSSKTVVCPLG